MNDETFKRLLESVQVHLGKGAPPSSLGSDLDLYIDQTTRLFYRKSFGRWEKAAEIVLGPLFTTGTMSWDQLLVDASLSAFFEIVVDGEGNRLFKLKPPANGGSGRTYYLGETNGVADWRDPAADFGAWLENLKNKPNGVPGLDEHGHLNPGIVFPDSYKKDVAGGIPGLDGSGKLKYDELPDQLKNDVANKANKNADNLGDSDVEAWKKKLGLGGKDSFNLPSFDYEHKWGTDTFGYMYLINGLLMQWGNTIDHTSRFNFPIAFPHQALTIVMGGTTAYNRGQRFEIESNKTFHIYGEVTGASGWIALGY